MDDIYIKINALRKTSCIARIAGEDMFWSLQEKENFLDDIDKEIDELYDRLQKENQDCP